MTASLALAGAELRRVVRDRTALFFMVLLPVLVILLVGATVSGNTATRVGIVGGGSGPLAARLAQDLGQAPQLETRAFSSPTDSVAALRRGEVAAVVELPPDLDRRLAGGGSATVAVVTTSAVAQSSQGALSTVRAVVARHAATVQAARFVTQHSALGLGDALTLARTVEAAAPPTEVSTTVVNSTANTLPLGFSYSAPTMLVLFVFVNALAGGAAMIQTRRLGVFARALAAPVRPRDIVLGEGLCYLLLALGQAALIVIIGALLFGVSWGNPLAAVALVGTWALVGTGAGMLSGTLFRTPEQASAIGPAVGIAFGMLGGCMWPLEIVPPAVRALGHLTPQAWAVDAWVVLLSRGGGLLDILRQLVVLLAFAAGLLVLASMRLRRSLAT